MKRTALCFREATLLRCEVLNAIKKPDSQCNHIQHNAHCTCTKHCVLPTNKCLKNVSWVVLYIYIQTPEQNQRLWRSRKAKVHNVGPEKKLQMRRPNRKWWQTIPIVTGKESSSTKHNFCNPNTPVQCAESDTPPKCSAWFADIFVCVSCVPCLNCSVFGAWKTCSVAFCS